MDRLSSGDGNQSEEEEIIEPLGFIPLHIAPSAWKLLSPVCSF